MGANPGVIASFEGERKDPTQTLCTSPLGMTYGLYVSLRSIEKVT